MRLFDMHHPFFQPMWRRVVVVAACLAWALFEVTTGAVFWAILFGALGVYAAWQFFFVPWPEPDESSEGSP